MLWKMAQDITWGWYKSIVVLFLPWLLLYAYLISFDNFFYLLNIPSDWFLVVITINLSVYNNMQNNTSWTQLHMVVVQKFSNLFTAGHQSLLNHWLLTHLNHLNSLNSIRSRMQFFIEQPQKVCMSSVHHLNHEPHPSLCATLSALTICSMW